MPGNSNVLQLANIAWAFAKAGMQAPALLDPILVLDAKEAHGAKPQVMYYHMSMQSLAATGRLGAGFALLERVEASGLLSHSDDDCYGMFHTLL